jgi:hypothetical protein
MPNRTEARPANAVLTYATGRLPLLRLFSTPLIDPRSAPITTTNLSFRFASLEFAGASMLTNVETICAQFRCISVSWGDRA